MPKIWKEMRIHLKGSSHVRNLPVFGKTLGFPPVSTSFPGPNPPGTVSSGTTMAAAEKAGAASFAAMAKGAADSTPSFDVVSVGCVRLYVVDDVDVDSVWLDVWCRFFVLVCFDYGSFLYVCWGEIALGRTWFCIFMEIRLESAMPSAFYIDPWQSWVSSMATFLTLEPQTSSRANPGHPTPKMVFLGFWLKMTPMTNQILIKLRFTHGFCFGVTWSPCLKPQLHECDKPRACTSLYMSLSLSLSLSLYIFYQSSVHPPLRYFLIRPTPPCFCPKNRASHPQLQTTCTKEFSGPKIPKHQKKNTSSRGQLQQLQQLHLPGSPSAARSPRWAWHLFRSLWSRGVSRVGWDMYI